MKYFAAFALFFAACGEVATDQQGLVTRGDAGAELAADAGDAVDVGQQAEVERGAVPVDSAAEKSDAGDATIVAEVGDGAASLCVSACEPCARAEGLDGPPYQTAAQCAKVIACARAGGDTFNAWQTCHSSIYYFGSGGLHCATAAVAAGCL